MARLSTKAPRWWDTYELPVYPVVDEDTGEVVLVPDDAGVSSGVTAMLPPTIESKNGTMGGVDYSSSLLGKAYRPSIPSSGVASAAEDSAYFDFDTGEVVDPDASVIETTVDELKAMGDSIKTGTQRGLQNIFGSATEEVGSATVGALAGAPFGPAGMLLGGLGGLVFGSSFFGDDDVVAGLTKPDSSSIPNTSGSADFSDSGPVAGATFDNNTGRERAARAIATAQYDAEVNKPFGDVPSLTSYDPATNTVSYATDALGISAEGIIGDPEAERDFSIGLMTDAINQDLTHIGVAPSLNPSFIAGAAYEGPVQNVYAYDPGAANAAAQAAQAADQEARAGRASAQLSDWGVRGVPSGYVTALAGRSKAEAAADARAWGAHEAGRIGGYDRAAAQRGREAEAMDVGAHSTQSKTMSDAEKATHASTGAGKSDGTVICTELVRQGIVEKELAEHSTEFAENSLHKRVHMGYLWWGIPAARLMRKSKVATWFASKLMPAWVNATKGKFTLLGWACRIIGEPICYLIGLFRNIENADAELEAHKKSIEEAK